MRIIKRVAQTICALLLFAGIGVNFSNVVGRYLFSQPLSWAEDFMVYTNIWLILLGAALASFHSRHLSMDVAESMCPPRLRRVVLLAITCIAAMACGATAWLSSQFVARMVASGQRSISLDVPMYIPHSAIAVGFMLMTLAFIGVLYRQVVHPESVVEPKGAGNKATLL